MKYLNELLTKLKDHHADVVIDIAEERRKSNAAQANGNTMHHYYSGIANAKQYHADYIGGLITGVEREIAKESK